MRQYVRLTGTDRLNDKFTPFTNGLPKCPDCIFNCLRDPAIPPNNNTSEREIRKWKIKLKNSGCFRYDLGADAFMDLHSIVETTREHGNSHYSTVLALFQTATTSACQPNSCIADPELLKFVIQSTLYCIVLSNDLTL